MIILTTLEMVIRIGINGFGRIGRVIFRTCFQDKNLEVSAINDPAVDIEYICYLIKFDSTHGRFRNSVTFSADEITIEDVKIKVFSEKVPSSISWDAADVHYVVESSGMFTSLEKASGHLNNASVKRVIVTAPTIDVPMMILGVNEDEINTEHKVISCSSSTLYCLAPIIKILQDNYGVAEGFITSIHAMTPSLKPLDGLCLRGKHWRDHRSIHQNIIPAMTGACKALGKIIPQVKDKMMGLAFRVPIVNVSVLDISVRLNKTTTIQDIIKCVEAMSTCNMKNIIKIAKEQEVSSDFLGDNHSCILDVNSCLQLNPNFFKLICWYENEYSYACRVIDSIKFSEQQNSFKSKISFDHIIALERPTREKCFLQINKDYYCYNISNKPKLLPTTSRDTRVKCAKRRIANTSPPSLQNSACNQSVTKESTRGNDIFKIWHNDVQKSTPSIVDNSKSFFQSFMTLSPTYLQRQSFLKTQENLQEVKKEITKMVDMTEKLLNKSSESQCEMEPLQQSMESKRKGLLKRDPKEHFDQVPNTSQKETRGCKSNMNRISNYVKTSGKEIINSLNKKDNNDYKQSSESAKVDGFNSLLKPKRKMNAKFTHENINTLSEEKEHSLVVQKLRENVKNEFNAKTTEPIEDIKLNNKENNTCNNCNKVEAGEIRNINNSNINILSDKENQNNCTFIDRNLNEENFQTKDIEQKVDISKNGSVTNLSKNDFNDINKSDNIPQAVTSADAKGELRNGKDEANNTISKKEYRKKIIEGIRKLSTENTLEESIRSPSVVQTSTTLSNGECYKNIDIYDKLDSVSATDSNNSFQVDEKTSQVIDVTDLTSSVEDLARLDKICRIIEISDELSDRLFSALDNNNENLKKKKWSLKDLCERLKLDDFCNNIFGLK